MKRFFGLFLAVIALASAASCAKEPVEPADPAQGGKPVTIQFDISLGNSMTKADNTPLDDASGTFQLFVAAFSAVDGSLVSTSKIGGTGYGATETLNGSGAKNVSLTLTKGSSYKVIFFAQREGAYDVSFAGGNVATFSYKSGLQANNGDLDAFYDAVDVTPSKTSYDVTLTRPFAQLNVLVKNENVPGTQTAFSSAMTVKAPTTFDLFAEVAKGESSAISFTNHAISATAFGSYATTHKWIGMNYVLVPADGLVEVTSFQESGMASAVAPGKIPVEKNGRTNLVGNLYSISYNATFTIQILPGFETPDYMEPIGPDKILVHDTFGSYLPGHERNYVAGDDQYVREYKGTTLDFVLLNADWNEQIIIRGYQTTMKVGDPVTISVDWKKDKTQVLLQDYEMTVVKEENRKVWIADQEGNGFVIKK